MYSSPSRRDLEHIQALPFAHESLAEEATARKKAWMGECAPSVGWFDERRLPAYIDGKTILTSALASPDGLINPRTENTASEGSIAPFAANWAMSESVESEEFGLAPRPMTKRQRDEINCKVFKDLLFQFKSNYDESRFMEHVFQYGKIPKGSAGAKRIMAFWEKGSKDNTAPPPAAPPPPRPPLSQAPPAGGGGAAAEIQLAPPPSGLEPTAKRRRTSSSEREDNEEGNETGRGWVDAKGSGASDGDESDGVVLVSAEGKVAAGARATGALPTTHLVGAQDVPFTYCSCWLVCLPGLDEERIGLSPTFDLELLCLTKRQELEHSLRWAGRLQRVYSYTEALVKCTSAKQRSRLTTGIATELGCHNACSDAMVADAAYSMACTRNYDELATGSDGISVYGQPRAATVDELRGNTSVARRLQERRRRADRAVASLKAGKAIERANWFGGTTDMAAAALILQRSVAVATEFDCGGVGMINPAKGFVTVAPAPPVTSVISHVAARGEAAARPEVILMKGPLPDARACVTLLHVSGATHFKRLLPVQSGREGGQHWVVNPRSCSEY